MKAHLRPLLLAARLVSAAVIIAFIYFGKVVLIPVALALLIAVGLQPFVKRLRRWHFPPALAVITTCLGFTLIIGTLSWMIGGQIAAFANDLPSYRKNIIAKITEAREAMRGGTIEKLQHTIDSVKQEVEQQPPPEPGKPGTVPVEKPANRDPEPVPVVLSSRSNWFDLGSFSTFGSMVEPLATLGLVALLAVMMLLQWSDLRGRLLTFLSENLTGTTHALNDAATRVGRYLGLQLIYNSSFGVVAGVALWLMGVPYAALWGLCAALFRYVPYAGPVAAAILPAVVSLVTSHGWTQVFAVVAMFLVLELISNNVVEPWLYGSNLGISEIGIVIATVFWTFLWGPAGLVLATPLTVCVVIIGLHVPGLSFFARLLGDRQLLAVHYQLYERLVARDAMEVKEIIRKHHEENGPESFGETMAVPALALARAERLRGRLRDESAQAFSRMLEENSKTGADRKETEPEAETASPVECQPPLPRVPVILWPACPFTGAALPFLQQKLTGLPADIEIMNPQDFAGQILERASSPDVPGIVCLAHLHRDDFVRVLGTLKRIRTQWPAAVVIVARWDGEPFSHEEQERLSSAGAAAWSSTLTETRNRIAAHAGDLATRCANPAEKEAPPVEPAKETAANQAESSRHNVRTCLEGAC